MVLLGGKILLSKSVRNRPLSHADCCTTKINATLEELPKGNLSTSNLVYYKACGGRYLPYIPCKGSHLLSKDAAAI